VARYRKSIGAAAAGIESVKTVAALKVAARLKGGSGTDFGVPSTVADFDRTDIKPAELKTLVALLRASWKAVDRSAARAHGKHLATGPRGGGRTLDKILEHVAEADRAYISSLGAKAPSGRASWEETQAAFVEAIHAKLRGELPEVGPRGGERWPARYAIRRSAWHALDHAWEIDDRVN
jgi:hypothetical protein